MADSYKENCALRVLEFYSGIGGMHYALKESAVLAQVVGALDINTTANQVYLYNFPDTPLIQRNIEGISIKEFSKLNADVFLMSPPCQPFSRLGNKGASNDPRTKSFLYILDILKRLPNLPNYLLMENVKGFEASDTREKFVQTLKECNYTYQEFLLTPIQFSIPNSRLRYYLLAKRRPLKFSFETTACILEHIPGNCKCSCKLCCAADCIARKTGATESSTCDTHVQQSCQGQHSVCKVTDELQVDGDLSRTESDSSVTVHEQVFVESATDVHVCTCQSCEARHISQGCSVNMQVPVQKHCSDCGLSKPWRRLSEYLETTVNESFWREYLLPDKVLSRFALLLDIVMPSSTHSCCFTKGYGHYAEGTGSVIQMADVKNSEVFKEYKAMADDKVTEKAELLSVLQLRYFTAREVANLMCFPQEFGFQPDVSVKQQYRLLGNSLNVHVVSELLKCLLSD